MTNAASDSDTTSVALARRPSPGEFPTASERARREPAGGAVIGWLGTLAVTLLAGAMRLWHLGYPKAFLFDETYYAKHAWSLLHNGYVRGYVESANDQILRGDLNGIWTDRPDMIVHPEVGKWLIATGEWVAGMAPYGWRLPSAIVGTLMVLVVIRLARRLTGSTLLGLVAGLLMTFDGLQFVLSRLALLDIFVAFFVLAAVSCLVADRDWFRRRLADAYDADRWPSAGPMIWWRPWLLASGLLWGLAVGTKWTALFPLAAFGLLFWAWSSGARRSFGVSRAWLQSAVRDAAPAVGYLVVLPFIVYLVSWTGWLLHADVYEQHLSHTQYGPYWGAYLEQDAHGFFPELWQSLRSLWHYHHDVFAFHTRFLNDATHIYQSSPWGWLVMERPVGVDAQLDIAQGEQGCAAVAGSTCLRQIILLGTPALWWLGTAAVAWSAVSWVRRRDWRYGLVTVGVLSTWLPWLRYDDRPIFVYYAIVIEPFLILGLTLLIGEILGRAEPRSRRRIVGASIAGVLVALVVANFVWFWPIYTDGLLTHAEWLQRIWFHRWI